MEVLGDINLEELMGEEFCCLLTRNKKFGFDLIVANESCEEIEAQGIHPDAVENFASFCRRFLASYEATGKTL